MVLVSLLWVVLPMVNVGLVMVLLFCRGRYPAGLGAKSPDRGLLNRQALDPGRVARW